MGEPAFPPGWKLIEGKASIEVRTHDFAQATDVLNRVARVAEDVDHHPDLHIEEYNRLRVVTWSHDVGGLTSRDERLARAVHDVLAQEGLVAPTQS